MRLVMAAQSKLRRFRPSSGYLLAMVDSYAEITATPVLFKEPCTQVDAVLFLCSNTWYEQFFPRKHTRQQQKNCSEKTFHDPVFEVHAAKIR
jgi:hypothetical protein